LVTNLIINMYEAHFRLKEKPFSISPDPRFIYLTAQHQEALAKVQYAISQRMGVSAIQTSMLFQVCEDLANGHGGEIARDHSPTAGKTAQMNKVKSFAVGEFYKEGSNGIAGQRFLQRDETLESKDGVIEVAVAAAVLETAIGVEAAFQEGGDEIAGLTQLLWRQSRHL